MRAPLVAALVLVTLAAQAERRSSGVVDSTFLNYRNDTIARLDGRIAVLQEQRACVMLSSTGREVTNCVMRVGAVAPRE